MLADSWVRISTSNAFSSMSGTSPGTRLGSRPTWLSTVSNGEKKRNQRYHTEHFEREADGERPHLFLRPGQRHKVCLVLNASEEGSSLLSWLSKNLTVSWAPVCAREEVAEARARRKRETPMCVVAQRWPCGVEPAWVPRDSVQVQICRGSRGSAGIAPDDPLI